MKPSRISPFVHVALIGLCLLGVSCSSETEHDRSIVLDEPFGNVQNGCAYDKASIDITKYKRVVLPDTAKVLRGGRARKLHIYMKKTLDFGGHPPEPMSIKQARKHMGCAVRVIDDALVVATYGEWDSHIEGGAFMRLTFMVPKGCDIERRENLSGENSIGRTWNGTYLTKPVNVKNGYWYGPASPAEGWRAVAAVADPDRTADPPGKEQ